MVVFCCDLTTKRGGASTASEQFAFPVGAGLTGAPDAPLADGAPSRPPSCWFWRFLTWWARVFPLSHAGAVKRWGRQIPGKPEKFCSGQLLP